jgi:hypothetical protein
MKSQSRGISEGENDVIFLPFCILTSCRTFPHHDFFTDGQGIGQENLFNVLKAYSLYGNLIPELVVRIVMTLHLRYDPKVGYCQGLPFIVAILLLNVRGTMIRPAFADLAIRCRTRKRFPFLLG